MDEALQRVEDAIAARGPFDALLAFSQGAIVTTLLTALALERQRTSSSVDGAPPPPLPWRRNVLVCGMPPRDELYAKLLAPPLDFPCTLIHGKADEYYAHGLRLNQVYRAASVYEHPDGHKCAGRGARTNTVDGQDRHT